MKPAALFLLAAAWAPSEEPPGLKPPPAAGDYRAHAERASFAVGANLLSPDQVRAGFSSDLNRAYLVVEVAVYPAHSLDIRHADFALRVAGSRDLLRPIAARTVAGVLQKGAPRSRDLDVDPSVEVGHETGRGYDPVTGQRHGGWDTSVGVGVGAGGRPPAASTGRDRRTMETELSEQALPEGAAAQPVAGYLYFAAPKKRNVTFDLEYRPGAERAVLPLVAP